MKTISCGIVIQNSLGDVLGLYPYGKKGDNTLDIPKGHMHNGESYIQCALRETYEETGLKILPSYLKDTGMWIYTKEKNLYLFTFKTSLIDISKLYCSSFFEYKPNMSVPEMVGYEWIPFQDIEKRFYKSLVPILKKILDK